eukprot:3811965-Prymnesium_polylepis.2
MLWVPSCNARQGTLNFLPASAKRASSGVDQWAHEALHARAEAHAIHTDHCVVVIKNVARRGQHGTGVVDENPCGFEASTDADNQVDLGAQFGSSRNGPLNRCPFGGHLLGNPFDGIGGDATHSVLHHCRVLLFGLRTTERGASQVSAPPCGNSSVQHESTPR